MSMFSRMSKSASSVGVKSIKAIDDDGTKLPVKLKREKGQATGALSTQDEKGLISFLKKEKGLTVTRTVKGEYAQATSFLVIDGSAFVKALTASDSEEESADRVSSEVSAQTV